MQISIITPVYNDPRIKRCIESVQSQVGDFEVEHIVVDSNSTDETVDIITDYNDAIDVLVREDDDGMYDAINKGILSASGDVVGILNADDRYQDSSALQSVAKTMNEQTIDACYGDLVYVDEQNHVARYWESGGFSRYKFYYGWMPPHPTFFLRSELYDEYGPFDLSFSIAADYEFMLRLLFVHGVSVSYIEDVLVRMATGGMSNTPGNWITIIREMYAAWKKHGGPGRFTAPFAHPLEKVPQYLRRPPEEVINRM